MDKIVFFKNQVTQYGVLHHFREALEWGFQQCGIETESLDIPSIDRSTLLRTLYRNPPDYTFALNGLQPFENGSSLCDELEIPHIGWLVDSADYFHGMAKSPWNVLISPDQQSTDLLTTWGALHSFFLPHAFDERLKIFSKPEHKKPIVFTGSLMDPDLSLALWKQHLPPAIVHLLLEAAEAVLNSSSLTYQSAFLEAMQKAPDFFKPIESKQISSIATTFDQYIRAEDRIRLLQSLKGLEVHIYGNCLSKKTWDQFLDLDSGSYIIHPPLNFSETIEVMKEAQILINSSPMFKTGAHERIFYGLGLQCAVLTSKTPWTDRHFTDDELITYTPSDRHNLAIRLKELLQQDSKLEEMARIGQQKVLKHHTWKIRAENLLKTTNTLSFPN